MEGIWRRNVKGNSGKAHYVWKDDNGVFSTHAVCGHEGEYHLPEALDQNGDRCVKCTKIVYERVSSVIGIPFRMGELEALKVAAKKKYGSDDHDALVKFIRSAANAALED